MKKLILPLVAMIICMASCQKENGLLYLETETYTGDAKLHLDSENFAVWDNNDKVLVNGTEYSVAVGSGNATITGVPEAESYTAIYPASWANSTSINYPAEQTYRGSQVVEAPMAAYSDGGTLTFHNLGSLLAVEVTNSSSETMSVQKIEVSAEGSTLINGTCAISGLSTGAPSLGGLSNGSTTTTLKCNGVSITAGNTETFYIAMPPVEAQLTIKVYDQYYAYTKTQASAHTMAASHGYAAPVATSDSPVQYVPLGNQFLYTAASRLSGFEVGDSKFSTTVTSHTFSNGQGVVTFESSFTSIPEKAFEEVANLQSIILSSNVTTIEYEAFYGCENLASVVAPNVTTIGRGAFSFSENLSSVVAPNVTTIGEEAFYKCEKLSSVVATNVTTVGTRAFARCGSFSNYLTLNCPNLTTIGSLAFWNCYLTTFDFSSVTAIGDEAFRNAFFDNLPTFDFSNVTTIGDYAFEHIGYGCITKLILPVPPVSWGNSIFREVSIEEIYFNSTAIPAEYVNAFDGAENKEYTSVFIPAGAREEVVWFWETIFGFNGGNIHTVL